MTINDNLRRSSQDGDGSNLIYDFGYKINTASELGVFLVTKATNVGVRQSIGTHYTVPAASVGRANGGPFTMVTAPTTSERIVTHGETPTQQAYDPTATQVYSPTALMAALDKLMMCVQENRRDLGYVLKYKVGTDNHNLTKEGGVADPDTAGEHLEAADTANPPDLVWDS